ncbi:MAG TPA: hypothetical protein VFK79_02345 [Xanthobacteraceae bacterium]|nr:hypothetical protein [Xanthobacteraceae bacterium]
MKTSAVCAAAAVPPTTALRWIKHLQAIGLLCTVDHHTDRRVRWLELSCDAQAVLDQYFDCLIAKQAQGSLGMAASKWRPVGPLVAAL